MPNNFFSKGCWFEIIRQKHINHLFICLYNYIDNEFLQNSWTYKNNTG